MSKHLASTDGRIRNIVQKHLSAMSEEIALEVTKSLLGQFGGTMDGILSGVVPTPTKSSDLPTPASAPAGAPSYDATRRLWVCPQCRSYSDPRRRAVTAHARFCQESPSPEPSPPLSKAKKRRKKKS